jgi:hypothetical protein
MKFIKFLPIDTDMLVVGQLALNVEEDNPTLFTLTVDEVRKWVNLKKEVDGTDKEYKLWDYPIRMAAPFLCTMEVQVGDKTFPFVRGGVHGQENNSSTWSVDPLLCGWPNEPHTIEDLNHSDYEPYRIRTDKGFGHTNEYVKVLGRVLDPGVEDWTFVPDENKYTIDPLEILEETPD